MHPRDASTGGMTKLLNGFHHRPAVVLNRSCLVPCRYGYETPQGSFLHTVRLAQSIAEHLPNPLWVGQTFNLSQRFLLVLCHFFGSN